MKFEVSVIIPVYNAEVFIEKAIKSALQQPEVLEVIVVNDGSTDGSLEIAEELRQRDSRVKIYHHKNNENKGRSASRNLGIEKSNASYIAFLDADDYYLENRFANDKTLFANDEDIEGVYNAVGLHFYHPVSTEYKNEMIRQFTLVKSIEPKKLFDALLSGTYGYFHINGLTLRRVVFSKIGLFNTRLMVSEDSDMFLRLALKCLLVSGNITDDVAQRGVHKNNVFYKRDLYTIYDLKLYESMYVWSYKNNMDLKTIERFLERIWILKYRKQEKKYKYLYYWIQVNLKAPRLLFSYLSIKYFPLVKYLGKLKKKE